MSDDFLSRWSRRKRETDAAEPAPEPAAAEPVAGAPAASPAESDEEVLARLGLRHPDEMGAGDDFAAFLRAAVPKHLKTLAYRRLWRSNPTLACVDGLNDYDGDFTGTGVPAGGLKTSYQVGRGILRRIAEAADEPTAEVPAEAAAAEEPEKADPAPGEAEAGNQTEEADPGEFVQENDTSRTGRRRMVFRART